MTLFQILMLGASAYFAYKIYEHIQTLQDPTDDSSEDSVERTADAFSPFDSTELIQKADDEMQKGNLDKALAIYSEANIKEPNNDEVLFKMGLSLAHQNRGEEALEYFQESLAIDASNPFTHLEMAFVYIKQEEFASARTHLNAALEIDPQLEKAQVELDQLNAGH